MMEMSASLLWSTPILEVRNPDHPRIKQAMVGYFHELERRSAQPIESGVTPMKKAGLYESKFDLFKKGETPEIQQLGQFCGQAVMRAVYDLYKRMNPGRRPPEQMSVDLAESWVHVTHDGGFHEVHYHPNCSWCGIYYVEAGDCSGNPPNGVNRLFPPVDIGYEDLGSMAYPHMPVSITPEDGKLILFPSYVRHSAMPYHGAKDRIVVAFNSRVFARPS